ncbi:MAG TPA: M48 family peptidase [Gammaproteobacteria bacterium]|nr:M48 family peptidase [Gammaproteobacteria bacterium]
MNALSQFFIIMILLTLATQFWLAARHIRHIEKNRSQVPDEFSGQIPLDAHQKAADYTVTRTRFGRYEALFASILALAWTLGGGLELLDQAWRSLQWDTIWTGIVFMLSVAIIMSVIDLPFSVYKTFVIEERFGFNKTTVKVFITDLLKGTVLTVLIGVPLLWVVLTIMEKTGSLWWLYVWGVWFGFSLFMMWAYPAFIAPIFNKFKPLENSDLKDRIEQLLTQCGFKSNGIFVMDGSRRSAHGNAYFSGIGNKKQIVFFDTLMEQLNAEEIEAVLAHELGHFRMHHIRKRIISMGAISLASLAVLGWLIQQNWFYTGLGVSTPSNYIALVLFMILAPLIGFFLTPIMSMLSRKHEFEADAYASKQRNAGLLITALVKMYEENASTLTPDPIYSGFYDSHPPAPVRIEHLKKQPQLAN